MGLALVPEGRRLVSLALGRGESLDRRLWRRPDARRGISARSIGCFRFCASAGKSNVTVLSGGQQQMIAIGRALMSNPSILLCDEISLGLAPIMVENIYQMIPRIREQRRRRRSSSSRTSPAALRSCRPLLLSAGGTRDAVGPAVGSGSGRHPRGLFRDVRRMTGFIDTVLAGVLLGGIYALFALGLSLIFGIMRLVNLAHGDLILLAAYLVLTATTALGVPLAVATVLMSSRRCSPWDSSCSGWCWSACSATTSCRPCSSPSGCRSSFKTDLLLVFGADSRRLQAGAFESSSIMLAPGLSVGLAPLTALIMAILAVALLQVVFYRTSLGRAFRATADNPQIAQLMGIDHRNIYAAAVGISLAVSAVAAVAFGIRANFDPSIGPARLLYAFEAVIIGGLGSLWGTLAGGIVLGLAQTIGAADRSGVANSCRPSGIPGRVDGASARPVSRGAMTVRARRSARDRARPKPVWHAQSCTRLSRVAGIVGCRDLAFAFLVPAVASRNLHSGPDFRVHHAGAGATLECARRLGRTGFGGAAGICRARAPMRCLPAWHWPASIRCLRFQLAGFLRRSSPPLSGR